MRWKPNACPQLLGYKSVRQSRRQYSAFWSDEHSWTQCCSQDLLDTSLFFKLKNKFHLIILINEFHRNERNYLASSVFQWIGNRLFLVLMNYACKLDLLWFGAPPPPLLYKPNERPTLALSVAPTSYTFCVHFWTRHVLALVSTRQCVVFLYTFVYFFYTVLFREISAEIPWKSCKKTRWINVLTGVFGIYIDNFQFWKRTMKLSLR